MIKDEIKKVLPNTDILDGVNGVTKEVKRQLELNNLLNIRLTSMLQSEFKLGLYNSKAPALFSKFHYI